MMRVDASPPREAPLLPPDARDCIGEADSRAAGAAKASTSNPSLVIRPATADDISRFSDMANKPSIRAFVAEDGGRLLGMGGIALSGGRWFAFVDVKDEMRAHKITIARAAIRFLEQCRRDGIRFIYAEVSPNEPGAQAWVESLGFEFDVRSQHFYRWSSRHG